MLRNGQRCSIANTAVLANRCRRVLRSWRGSCRIAGVQNILIVDDQADVLEALRLLLKGGGYASQLAESPRQAVEAAAAGKHDLVMIDMNYARDTTSGAEGLALLETLRGQHPAKPVVVMTAWSTIDLAVEAMRRGATDFITKPWENQRVLEMLARHTGGRQAELSLAQRVQRRLLPPQKMQCAGFTSECAFIPAGEVGGDLCDVFDNAFLLGDVAGKGTAAALLMANLQASVRGHRELFGEPSLLMDRVNRLFFESTAPEHYATMFFGVYDAAHCALRYVNCGHPAALLVRQSGEVEKLPSTATVLGAFDSAGFDESRVDITAGDRLVVFSDGVSEADPDDESWIEAAVKQGSPTSLAMAAARGGIDDITVLQIRFA